MAGSTNSGVTYFGTVVGSRVPPGNGSALAVRTFQLTGTSTAAPVNTPAFNTCRRFGTDLSPPPIEACGYVTAWVIPVIMVGQGFPETSRHLHAPTKVHSPMCTGTRRSVGPELDWFQFCRGKRGAQS